MSFRAKPAIAALLLTTALTSAAAAQSTGLLTDPNTWRTPEYLAQWGLDTINAAKAYARGVDGTGVLVGVIDTGIFAGHSEFIGRYGGGYDYPTGTAQAIDRSGHGTMVSSVIAANRDGTGMHGVAPGATLVVAGAEIELGWVETDLTTRAYADLQARGVRIINNSYGDDRPITAFTRDSILAEYASDIPTFRRAVAAGVLSIWGTANQGLDQPSAQAGLPHIFPELERGWLAVAGYAAGYEPWYTNRCGVAKNWCLTAPGGGDWFGTEFPDDPIVVANNSGGYSKVYGTSVAAPHVAGAAALVWQMFPFFTADQVRQTLLGTARDIGDPGVDEKFGYGLLDVGKAVLGPGRFDWGDFVVEQPGGVAFFENDIVGAGGLVKRGGGELVLTGHSAYAGATRVEGGFLSVMGSIASATTVSGLGVLAGSGVINGAVDNAGTVWAGDGYGVGVLTINGNYVQRPEGVLVQQIDGTGGLNHLAVTGTASLAGRVAFAGGNTLLPRLLSMPVLSAGEGISGRFDGVEGPAGDGTAAFIRASLRYQPRVAYLDIRTLPFDSPQVCASANQCAAGSGLERGVAGGDRDLRAVAALLQSAGTRAGAQRALAALSGETQANLGTLALGGFSPFAGMIERRLAARRAGPAEPSGGWSPALAYAPGATNDPLAAMLRQLPAARAAPESSAWLRGYGLFGRLGGDVNAGGGAYRGGGAIGGVDRQFTPSFLAGVSVGYSSMDADFRNFAGNGSVKAYEGALYGSHASGPLRLDGILGYARLGFDSQRSIAFGALSRRARAEYDGDRFSGALEAGYGVDLGWSKVEPLAGLRYTFLRQDGVSETGAGSIGLRTPSQSAQSLLGSLGLRLATSFDIGTSRLALEARGRWQHEFLDDVMVLNASFIGAPAASFPVRGARVARDSAVIGAGLSLQIGRRLTLFADYDASLNGDVTAHAATAGLRVTW
ncbi:Outer membrane autotransporter barrel precursor [Bosea sp. LC85]|uniref:autotransporter domain-containing protein n=1 Tax=Bosea sp. LC85 TaxID=1502851 RepID=UPI0004E299D1|nr:autotransporter domain-containing protein [Bosea sp. LC85]KFC74548.1 Outer membrane autotransporter barrel precursor [Bosea sp. LC85]